MLEMTAPFDVHVFEEKQPFKDFKEYVNVVDEDYTINKARLLCKTVKFRRSDT